MRGQPHQKEAELGLVVEDAQRVLGVFNDLPVDKERLLIFDMLETLLVHLDELLVIENLVLIVIVCILRLILLIFHNMRFLVLDVDVFLLELLLVCVMDILSLESLHLLGSLVAELYSLLEDLFERRTLVDGSRRVTDLRVQFLP